MSQESVGMVKLPDAENILPCSAFEARPVVEKKCRSMFLDVPLGHVLASTFDEDGEGHKRRVGIEGVRDDFLDGIVAKVC